LSIIKVDQTKCTKCGMCSEVCPSQVISLGDHGPEMVPGGRCIACGHCVAICPHAALDNEKNPLEKQVPIDKFPVLDAVTAARFLRSRRSVRCYKAKPVEHETILELLDIARYAPTASNSQGLSYLVLDGPEVLKKITAAVIDWMEEQYQAGLDWAQRYGRYVTIYRETGKDVILRGAPTLVIALADQSLQNGWDNARYSLAYAELYATALWLGTAWAGFVENCAKAQYQPLLELLQVAPGKKICGAIMVGYPKYVYRRLVERAPLEVFWG
jgi:nitroreductase/NAD-dependent dihydropyrimidine dehydrogenase PreA subunit